MTASAFDVDRQLAKLDAMVRSATDGGAARFKALVESVVEPRVLNSTLEDRVEMHLRGYATRGTKLDIEGVKELMFTMWAEGFVTASALSEQKYTGVSPLD